MSNAAKLWAAFKAVAAEAPDAELQAFAVGLFFASPPAKLPEAAKRIVRALAARLQRPAPEVYAALASQTWGRSGLEAIRDAVKAGRPFAELDAANRGRLESAARAIQWPQPAPGDADQGDADKGRHGAALAALAGAAGLLILAIKV